MKTTALRRRPAWQRIGGRLARWFGVHYYDLYYARRDLKPAPETAPRSSSTEVRLATPGDLSEIIRRLGGEAQRLFDHNVAIHSVCHVAVHEGEVAGYLWVNRQVADLLGMRVGVLPEKHSFSHSAFVFPECRDLKIYQRLRQAVCRELYGAGCRSIACLVDKANTQSIGALERERMEFHNAAVLKLPGIKPLLLCRAFA